VFQRLQARLASSFKGPKIGAPSPGSQNRNYKDRDRRHRLCCAFPAEGNCDYIIAGHGGRAARIAAEGGVQHENGCLFLR